MENKMFCFQCQETAGCTGCTKFGVCGKSPDLARMQDLLVYVTKGISEVTTRLREEGKTVSAQVNNYITINLFTTITNANFDDEVFYARVKETLVMKNDLLITRLTEKDIEGAYELFKITIPDTFKKSGGECEEELIEEEIHHKKEILYEAVKNKSILFWVDKDK